MNLVDIIIICVLAFYVISGIYRGFITSGLTTLGFVGAWFGARHLYSRVANLALSNTTLMAVLNQYLEPESFFSSHTQAMTSVAEVVSGGEAAIQNAVSAVSKSLSVISGAFEANVRSQMFQKLNISTLSDYLDQTIWQAIFNVGAFILAFIVLYIVVSLLVNLLDHVVCWPVFRGFDWLLGGLFGFARGVIITILVLNVLPTLVQVVSPEFAESLISGSALYNMINQVDYLNVGTLMRGLIGG